MVTYTTVAKVSAYLGEDIDSSSTPTEAQVEEFIERAEQEIDDMVGTSYQSQTATDEYHDYDRYSVFVKDPQLQQIGRVDHMFNPIKNIITVNNRPIISVTSLSVNQGTVTSPDWKSLTEDTDFVKYPDEGTIVIVKSGSLPVESYRSIKVTYTWGHTSVPNTIEKLCTLMAVKEVLRVKQLNSSYNSMDSISIETISITKSTSESVELLSSIQDEIERLKKEVVGTINYQVV